MKKNSATSPSSAAASAAAASAAVSAMAGYDLTNPHSLLVAGNPETLSMMPPPPHHHQHMQHQHQVDTNLGFAISMARANGTFCTSCNRSCERLCMQSRTFIYMYG